MKEIFIIDAGYLVAYLNKNDFFHNWAVDIYGKITPPFISCEAVISEAAFVLKNIKNGNQLLFNLLSLGIFKFPLKIENHITDIKELLNKYQNVPMSFADACLVLLTEKFKNSTIVTLDNDFLIYRKNKNEVIPLITPHQN